MEIRVYSPTLHRLGVVENHTSLIWTRRYFEPGAFELHAPITPQNLQLLQAGNIITRWDKEQHLAVTEAGVIGSEEKEESDIKNQITVSGRFLSHYFDRRLIYGPLHLRGRVEDIIYRLIADAAPIPLIRLGEQAGHPETVELQVTMKNLGGYLSKLARAYALGLRLQPDFKARELVFSVYRGIDRTLSQIKKNRVIFSEQYENLNNAIHKKNTALLKTKVFVGGEGEGAQRVYVTVGSGEGLSLREMFVDARDIRSEGLTPEQYRGALRQRGIEKLSECITTESMECETQAHINFRYKEHYDLGDIVTVKKPSWGITMHQRITEISEVYQFGGMFVAPTLGDALPAKIDWED